MKTLIIADPHEEIDRLEYVLKSWPADRVVVIGDYFDSFYQPMEDLAKMTKWVKAHLADPNFTLLLGNHDLHYGFPKIESLRCSGYNLAKQTMISHILKQGEFRSMKLHCWVDGWLLTHAGLHPSFAHPMHGLSPSYVDQLCEETLSKLHMGECPDLLRAGRARRGPAPIGGITWCDWSLEFIPAPGLNQIVGHSCGLLPREKNTSASRNICIDTRLGTVIMMIDGEPKLIATEAHMLPDWVK